MEGTAASVSHRDAWLVCTPSKLVLLLFVLEIALMLRGFQSGWLALLGILAFVLAILGLVAWFWWPPTSRGSSSSLFSACLA